MRARREMMQTNPIGNARPLALQTKYHTAIKRKEIAEIETICIAGGSEYQLTHPELPDYKHLMTAWTTCALYNYIPISPYPRVRIQNFDLGNEGDVLKFPKANGITPELLILANIPHPPSEQEAKEWSIGRRGWLGISSKWNEPQVWDQTMERSEARIVYITGYDPTTVTPQMIKSKRYKPIGHEPHFLYEQTYAKELESWQIKNGLRPL